MVDQLLSNLNTAQKIPLEGSGGCKLFFFFFLINCERLEIAFLFIGNALLDFKNANMNHLCC